MCLLVRVDKYYKTKKAAIASVIKTVTKPITVYKAFRKNSDRKTLRTYYQDFFWPLTKSVSIKKFGIRYTRESGYYRLHIHQGLHACLTKAGTHLVIGDDSAYPIKKMIIPKGAKYFDDGTDIVADKMWLKSAYDRRYKKKNAGPKRKNPARGKRKLAKKRT